MISNIEKKIAIRYLKTNKKDGFLNIITIFSFVGISLGVAILIIVMSVMNGFRSELIDKIIGFNAHAVVKPYDNPIDTTIFSNKNLRLISEKLILSSSGEGVIINKDYTKGILLRGYSQKSFKRLIITQNKNFVGNTEMKHKHISIGKELSFLLNVDLGDKILLMSPSGVKTIIGSLPKQEAFIVDSIFESGLKDFDQNVAFLNIKDLENFFGLNKIDRYLEIYLKNPEKINQNKRVISNIFTNEYIYTWADLNKSLFSALKVERNVMFIILSLIIVVAAFNIISGLTILVKNKRFVEIFLKNPTNIESSKKIIQNIFENDFVFTWADLNKSLFSALKVERNVMFIILSLIIIVAAFNIISGLTILVKNKTREIAILKSIGVKNNSIKKIFFIVGFVIGTSATLFGILLGVIFSIYIENIRKMLSDLFNISLFPEEIYFLSKMPSEININSIFLIAFCSIFITLIVSIFPAIKASKLEPVKALKYEW